MKVDKVLSRFAAADVEDDKELRRLARALGDELARHRPEVLRAFRAGLARASVPDDTFAAGYISSLLDVTAEYEVHLRQRTDRDELAQVVVREDWRALMALLEDGAKLPSELATRLGKDRPSITRILKRLRAAGLVQAYANESSQAIDGRTRPHRLTVEGRRVLDASRTGGAATAGAPGELVDDVHRGIQLAVGLFRHLVTHASSPAPDLDAIARGVLGDREAARAAVAAWAADAMQAGLIAEFGEDGGRRATPGRAPGAPPDRYHLATTPPYPPSYSDALDARNQALWHRVPDLLSQIQRRKADVPVYVRTSKGAWGAWAYELQRRDATGMSRAIVDGDILSRSVEPPDRRFDLVYDDPQTIEADRQRPTMAAFMERADDKFVVASGGEDVPDDFIQLSLTPGHEE